MEPQRRVHRIAMKRKRKSTSYPTKVGSKDEQIEEMGPVITDLPKFICQIILLKLSTRRILICKCVCKTWPELISDPEFAKMHFTQAEAYPLLRPWGPTRVSRTLYLVEPEDDFSLALKEDYLSDCDHGLLKVEGTNDVGNPFLLQNTGRCASLLKNKS